MTKSKKSIACFLTLALIWTSLPWTSLASNVPLVEPVRTQVSGIAGLSPSSQVQFASNITSFAAQLAKLPSFSALQSQLSQTGGLSSVRRERLVAFTRDAVAFINRVISQPDATLFQIEAGKAIQMVLLDPHGFGAQVIGDLENMSQDQFPEASKQSAQALSLLTRNYPSDLGVHSITAKALADLQLDLPQSLDAMYDRLRALEVTDLKGHGAEVLAHIPIPGAAHHDAGLAPYQDHNLMTDSQLIGSRVETLRSGLTASFDRLKQDPYYPDSASGKRYRAAARIEVVPDPTASGGVRISAFPGASFQDTSGEAHYPGIEPTVLQDQNFSALVLKLAAQAPEEVRRHGVQIGVHQIRVADGEVTPEGWHQDDFTDSIAIWVVNRRNAVGGENRLAADSKGEKIVMSRVLESGEILTLDNRRLWHEVLPISRKDKSSPAIRDVFVFSISALSPAINSIPLEAEAEAIRTGRKELMKPAPNVGLLRRIYEAGSARVRASLYQAFKGWTRYFSQSDEADQWTFVKSAAAPWAGKVYVNRLKSYLEYLAEMQGQGDKAQAAQEAQKVHQADHAFGQAFVQAANAVHPAEQLDAQEAEEAISDEVLYRQFIEPVIQGKQKGKFDRKAALVQVAQRIKDSLYAYSDVTAEQIEKLLAQASVKEKFYGFLDLLEQHIPQEEKPSQSTQTRPSISKGSIASRVQRLGGTLGLILVVFALAWQAITGHPLLESLGLSPRKVSFGVSLAAAAVLAPPLEVPAEEKKDKPQAPKPLPPFLRDFTQEARDGLLEPVYFREKEIEKLRLVLNSKLYTSALMAGDPGVGKTAVLKGLAHDIVAGRAGALNTDRVLYLDIGRFFEQAGNQPDTYARAVRELLETVKDGQTILGIDEAQQLSFDPKAPLMSMNFYEQLKTHMEHGELKLVLMTNEAKRLEEDPALKSRLHKFEIEPLSPGAAMMALQQSSARFGSDVTLTWDALRAAVELSKRAFRYEALVRIAMKALDTAAALVRGRRDDNRIGLLAARKRLLRYLEQLRQARQNKDTGRQEIILPEILSALQDYQRYHGAYQTPASTEVTATDVEQALHKLGAKSFALEGLTPERLLKIRKILEENLKGKPEIIEKIMSALERRAAMPDAKEPIFSALLDGVTGTGKTQVVKALALALYDISDIDSSPDIIRINGHDYAEKHSVSRLVGAPPGYIGHGDPTVLDRLKNNPYVIILVDEAGMMHPDVRKIFYSILDDGSTGDTRGKGDKLDFSKAMIVFTDNYGVPPGYERMSDEGFVAAVRSALEDPKHIEPDGKGNPFTRAFLQRLSLIEIFPPLDDQTAFQIADWKLGRIQKSWVREHGVEVEFADRERKIKAVLAQGYSRADGARGINRALADLIETPLSQQWNRGQLRRGDKAVFGPDGSLQIEKSPQERNFPMVAASGAAAPLAARLEEMLAHLQLEQALTLDILDQALDGSIPQADASFHPRSPLQGFSPQVESEPMKQHAPKHADPALDQALDQLRQALPAGLESVVQGVKALALKAKRLNLEAVARGIEGPDWEKGFFDTEQAARNQLNGRKAELQKKLGEIVKRANQDKEVHLAWEIQDGRLRAVIEANSYLTFEEEDRILEALAGRIPVESPDAALSELGKAVTQAGGALGYERQEDRTLLWVEYPIPGAQTPSVQAEPAKESAPETREDRPAASEPEPKAVTSSENLSSNDPLLSLAQTLLNPKTPNEDAYHAVNELREALTSKPQNASPALEKALRSGLEPFFLLMSKRLPDHNNQYDKADIVLVGKAYVPNYRIRALFDLYSQLLASRPDLAPAEVRELIRMGLGFDTNMAWGEDEQVREADVRGNEVALWIGQQVAGWAKTLVRSRSELLPPDLLVKYANSALWQEKQVRHWNAKRWLSWILAWAGFGLLPYLFGRLISMDITDRGFHIFLIAFASILNGLVLLFLPSVWGPNHRRSKVARGTSDTLMALIRGPATADQMSPLIPAIFDRKTTQSRLHRWLFRQLKNEESPLRAALLKQAESSPEVLRDQIAYFDPNKGAWLPNKGYEGLFLWLRQYSPRFMALTQNRK